VDIRAFDRIAWVDVHLLHATVSLIQNVVLVSPDLCIPDRHRVVPYGVRADNQCIDLNPGGCGFLLRQIWRGCVESEFGRSA